MTMRSPSSTTRSRSTPCVAGCCGPMLSTMSAVARPPAPRPTSSARWPVSEVTPSVCRTRTRGPRSAAGEGLAAGGPARRRRASTSTSRSASGASASSLAPTDRVCSGSPAATQWCSRKVVPSRTGMSKVFLVVLVDVPVRPDLPARDRQALLGERLVVTSGSVQRSRTSTSTSPARSAPVTCRSRSARPLTSLVGAP